MFANMLSKSKSKVVVSFVTAILAGSLIVSNAAAQTLETVKSRGKVVIGIQSDNPPYGFLDSQGRNDGYDADVAKLFADYLGVPADFFIVTNPNRIAAL